MKYTIIPILHGVEGFGLDKNSVVNFVTYIREFLPEQIKDYCVFPIVDWDDVVAQRQLEAFEMERDLPREKLLKLKHCVGSDILWDCQTNENGTPDSIYTQITQKIHDTVDPVIKKHGEDSNLAILGHSWGGQRAFSYCFNAHYKVSGVFTMGAPITAVSGRFLKPNWGKLPDGLKFWVNFRMKYDWIGSQFKYHKNAEFRNLVEDVHLSSWNPKTLLLLGAHTHYWSNKEVAKKIADTILKHFYFQA